MFDLWVAACAMLALPLRGHQPPRPYLFDTTDFQHAARPLVFAHRGGGGTGPEATIPTMLATVRRDPGVVIEFDVHRSRDGQLVVIHDATVDRTTNGSGLVKDLTVSELK